MAQLLMELSVECRCGRGYDEKNPERTKSRNGYGERTWDTCAGSVELKIPKMRQGRYFPGFLAAPAHRRGGAYCGHPEAFVPGIYTPSVDEPTGRWAERCLQEPGEPASAANWTNASPPFLGRQIEQRRLQILQAYRPRHF